MREVLLGRYTGGDNDPPPQGRVAYAVIIDPATCVHGSVPSDSAPTTTEAVGAPFCVGIYDAHTGDAIVGIDRP